MIPFGRLVGSTTAHPLAMLLGWQSPLLQLAPEALWSAWVIGQPGFGKSTLLGNIAEACAQAGEGVLVLDIKGDLSRQIAKRTTVPERLIYIDPLDCAKHERYWTLNPLAFDRTHRTDFEVYANALFELFVFIGTVDPSIMVKIQKVMTQAIRLCLARADTTLTDVYLALWDEQHRRYLLSSDRVPLRRRCTTGPRSSTR